MQKFTTGAAFSILAIMGILMVGSSWNDSAITDELPHIPAGYAYLVKQDYRLNPEHPPLIKMLAAVPLLFQTITFPADSPHWKDDVNGQWDFGRDFLYRSGNDADAIIFWSRIPSMLLALVTGWLLFSFSRQFFGAGTALLALTFFAFSPTMIAHSRFVTTDLGATFGFLIGILTFVKFLQEPGWKRAVQAGIAFGIAQLLKFSLVLIIPIYFIIFAFWLYAKRELLHGLYAPLLAKFFSIFVVGALLIGTVYQYAVWNYPPERQKHDAEFLLASFAGGPGNIQETCSSLSRIKRCPAEIAVWASDKPILRPYAEYLLGVLMVSQRQAGGNTAYFLGEVSNLGERAYFPTAFLLKEPIPILVFIILALSLALHRLWSKRRWSFQSLFAWIAGHPLEFSSLVFIIFYWGISIQSPLNIGLRHVLPTFPFMYLLTARTISQWITSRAVFESELSGMLWIRAIAKNLTRQAGKYFFLYLLVLWLIAETVLVAPSYLAYYNELAGGTKNGYRFIVDSNYDWGQDLKRLRTFVEDKNIEKIAVDYFGGGDAAYYLGEKFQPWWSAKGPAHGWFAVSATIRQGAFGKIIPSLERKTEDSYEWLKPYKPVARAGDSIFIYNLP